MDAIHALKHVFTRAAWLLPSLILAACVMPGNLFFEEPPVGQPGETTPRIPTPTFTVVPTDTPEPPTAQPCAFVWATKPLPDETALLQDALQKANLSMVEVSLEAYGENCVDTASKKVVSFNVMQTDFYFNVPVKDLKDAVEKGNWTAKLLAVIQAFPPGKVPGPNRGQVGVSFQTLSETAMLRFTIPMGLEAMDAGLSGEALFNALRQP